MTFHSHFIHRTLSKLQKLKTTDIVQATSSYAFVFYCILAISVIVILLFCCCCPGLMISMVKCIIGNMMQFLSYVIALGYEGLHFVYTAAIAAYRARQQEAQNQSNVLDNTIAIQDDQLAHAPTEAQIMCNPTVSHCPLPQTARPTRSSRPILKLKLEHVGEQSGARVSELSGGQEMVPFLRPTAPPVASQQLYPPIRSQQSFQSIFRD